MRRTKLVLLLGAVLLAGMAPAAARQNQAPILIDSSPSDGETVHEEAPARVEMTFSEPLDDSSEIEVRDECNRRVDAGGTTVQLNEMSVAIDKKPSGVYVASYSATGIAGLTGTTDGSIAFTVHMGPSCDGSGGGHGRHGGGGGNGNGGDHDDHDEGSGSGDHSGEEHGSGTTAAGGHSSGGTHAAAGGDHAGHGKQGKGKGKDGDHGNGDEENGASGAPATSLAAPGDLVPAPDGSTLLLALGASILFGAAGGLLVRVGVRL